MPYFLFLLVTATMFIRPGEIIPAIQDWPIYNYLIICCMIVSIEPMLAQLSVKSLTENPITACIVGIWVAIVCSHLAQFRTWEARDSGFTFFKVVAFYLLLVTSLDSPARLRSYMKWLFVFIAVLAIIALLAAYNIVSIGTIEFYDQKEVDKVTGEMIHIDRLTSTGIFQDPNDLAMILVVGMVIACYFLVDPVSGPQLRPSAPANGLASKAERTQSRIGSIVLRWLAIPTIGLFGFAIFRTQSRGGLMALMASLTVLGLFRFGWRRTVLAGMVAVPLLLVVMKGRMTSMDEGMDEGTGHSRVELWSDGFQLLKRSPLFGIGQGQYADEVGQVAHNSFVHAFVELGLPGGAFFLGAFVAAIGLFYRMRSDRGLLACGEVRRMLPFLLAAVVGTAVSMFSLSRNYVSTPYVVLGLAAAWARLAAPWSVAAPLRYDGQFIYRIALGSVGFIVTTYVFILVSTRLS
ncbi:MAG: O-antigen ligase family protein [Planctomycetota bacterium]